MKCHVTEITCFCIITSAYAGILQLPIQAQHNIHDFVPPSSKALLGRPVKSFQNFFYKTNITIGTPPQTFSVALDNMMDELFVQSAACKEPCHYPPFRRYNSSESSSYIEHGGSVSTRWAGMSFTGPLSYDTIHLGDNNVTTFLFEEWTYASCSSFGCVNYGYDGVLGLAPPWNVNQKHGQNMLSQLLFQKTLDEPVFSLKLPIGLHEEGEILFGATNSKFNSSAFIDLPAINSTIPYSPNGWTVPASHISFASPKSLELSLPSNAFAILDLGNPYLILPAALAQNLTAAIGAGPGPAWFHHIPCERRQELPPLTFTLDGHNFTISAFEYTLETHAPNFPRLCITSFMGANEFGFSRDWEGIVLGNPFIRGFHSVWNFEERKISFAKLD